MTISFSAHLSAKPPTLADRYATARANETAAFHQVEVAEETYAALAVRVSLARQQELNRAAAAARTRWLVAVTIREGFERRHPEIKAER